MDNRPIGVFDSGVGGLTVLKELTAALPGEDMVYFGDTARAPYGSKTVENLTIYSAQAVRFLLSKDCKAFVIACNATSSNCAGLLRANFPYPFTDVIAAGVDAGVAAAKRSLGMITTEATARSGLHERLIRAARPGLPFHVQVCPLFVPIVEEGWADTEVAYLTAQTYLTGLMEKDIDALLLGCTHYPILENVLRRCVGGNVELVDPAVNTAAACARRLAESGLLHAPQESASCRLYCSGSPAKFDAVSRVILGRELPAEKINIEEY